MQPGTGPRRGHVLGPIFERHRAPVELFSFMVRRELADGPPELVGRELALHRVEDGRAGDQLRGCQGRLVVEDQVKRMVLVLLLEGRAGVMAPVRVQVPVVGLHERGAALCVLRAVVEVATAPGAVGRVGRNGGAGADGAGAVGDRAGHDDGKGVGGENGSGAFLVLIPGTDCISTSFSWPDKNMKKIFDELVSQLL